MIDGKAPESSQAAAGAHVDREGRPRSTPLSERIAAALKAAGYSPDRIEQYLRSEHGA